jgi:UDP-sugar transporter A1/2/3
MSGTVLVQEPPTRKPSSAASAEDDGWSFIVGVGATVVACVCSSVASVYLEKILIESRPSIWVRNVQLCIFTIPIAFSGAPPSNAGPHGQKSGRTSGSWTEKARMLPIE